MGKLGNGGVCYVFKNGCKVHEYEDCFVVTDPKGLNIGERKTMLGAEAIVEAWEREPQPNSTQQELPL